MKKVAFQESLEKKKIFSKEIKHEDIQGKLAYCH